jgi:hypothetical protein
VPREISRTGKIAVELGLGYAKALPNALPDCLLTLHGQRHVDAVQSHPVKLTFPPIPIPECGGVAIGTHVVVLDESVGRNYFSLRPVGKAYRK